jgi:TetR/AcrR family transcriptional regulator, lmrAB and yxaGH operons repressor
MSPTQRRGDLARAKLLSTTAELLHRQGYAATGLNQILDVSGAPKGSLYFHFPGGKEQLVAAALDRSGEGLASALAELIDGCTTPATAVTAVVRFFATQLESSRFEKGCPIATVALEQAATSDLLHQACKRAYAAWQRLIERRLVRDGWQAARASDLASLILSTIEGALLISRARRSVEPLERAGAELARILEGDRR